MKNIITLPKVAEVMKSVNRGEFCDFPECAYYDCPQSIGFNATISAPFMHALVLQVLSSKLTPGAKALDIGCGSGYLCPAMLAMMDFDGKVVGIEHIPELASKCIKNIEKSYMNELREEKICIYQKDGREGFEAEGPFD